MEKSKFKFSDSELKKSNDSSSSQLEAIKTIKSPKKKGSSSNTAVKHIKYCCKTQKKDSVSSKDKEPKVNDIESKRKCSDLSESEETKSQAKISRKDSVSTENEKNNTDPEEQVSIPLRMYKIYEKLKNNDLLLEMSRKQEKKSSQKQNNNKELRAHNNKQDKKQEVDKDKKQKKNEDREQKMNEDKTQETTKESILNRHSNIHDDEDVQYVATAGDPFQSNLPHKPRQMTNTISALNRIMEKQMTVDKNVKILVEFAKDSIKQQDEIKMKLVHIETACSEHIENVIRKTLKECTEFTQCLDTAVVTNDNGHDTTNNKRSNGQRDTNTNKSPATTAECAYTDSEILRHADAMSNTNKLNILIQNMKEARKPQINRKRSTGNDFDMEMQTQPATEMVQHVNVQEDSLMRLPYGQDQTITREPFTQQEPIVASTPFEQQDLPERRREREPYVQQEKEMVSHPYEQQAQSIELHSFPQQDHHMARQLFVQREQAIATQPYEQQEQEPIIQREQVVKHPFEVQEQRMTRQSFAQQQRAQQLLNEKQNRELGQQTCFSQMALEHPQEAPELFLRPTALTRKTVAKQVRGRRASVQCRSPWTVAPAAPAETYIQHLPAAISASQETRATRHRNAKLAEENRQQHVPAKIQTRRATCQSSMSYQEQEQLYAMMRRNSSTNQPLIDPLQSLRYFSNTPLNLERSASRAANVPYKR